MTLFGERAARTSLACWPGRGSSSSARPARRPEMARCPRRDRGVGRGRLRRHAAAVARPEAERRAGDRARRLHPGRRARAHRRASPMSTPPATRSIFRSSRAASRRSRPMPWPPTSPRVMACGIDAEPFRPVLRGMLFTGGEPRFMRAGRTRGADPDIPAPGTRSGGRRRRSPVAISRHTCRGAARWGGLAVRTRGSSTSTSHSRQLPCPADGVGTTSRGGGRRSWWAGARCDARRRSGPGSEPSGAWGPVPRTPGRAG